MRWPRASLPRSRKSWRSKRAGAPGSRPAAKSFNTLNCSIIEVGAIARWAICVQTNLSYVIINRWLLNLSVHRIGAGSLYAFSLRNWRTEPPGSRRLSITLPTHPRPSKYLGKLLRSEQETLPRDHVLQTSFVAEASARA